MKIYNCVNRIGDALYSLRTVDALIHKHAEPHVIVCDDNDIMHRMFASTFYSSLIMRSMKDAKKVYPSADVVDLAVNLAADLAFSVVQSEGKELNISEAYGRLFGLKINPKLPPLTRWQKYGKMEPEYICIAPFSASCASREGKPRNKSLDNTTWELIIGYLRNIGMPLKILGGPHDSLRAPIAMDEYHTATSLEDLEKTLRKSLFLVSLDNGINHIAASMDIPTICFWPLISSLHFIAPLYAEKTCYLQFNALDTSPAAIFAGFRKFVPVMVEGNYEKIIPAKTKVSPRQADTVLP